MTAKGKGGRVAACVGGIALCAALVGAQTEYELLSSNTNANVRSFLGGSNGKLVYVNYYNNVKKLHYIDFAEGDTAPVIHRIAAVVNPTAPMISHDGKWVVYAQCDGEDGEAGTPVNVRASIYICRLADTAQPVLLVADSGYEPRFLWDSTPNATPNRLTIVYPTLAPDFAWEGIGKTMLLDIDTAGGGVVKGTPRVLFQSGGYTGGLSANGRYLCGGGGWAAMIDLQSGKTRPDTLADPYTGQACNASITSSRVRPNMMMYLDFGDSAQVIPMDVNGGQPWGQWQLIWVSAFSTKANPGTRPAWSKGEVVRWYKYPTNPANAYLFVDPLNDSSKTSGRETFRSASWHHEEWSNHPYYAASAVVVDRAYKHPGWSQWVHTTQQERLYLINIYSGDSGAYEEIARRKNITLNVPVDSAKENGVFWPTLWVDVPGTFHEDTLGDASAVKGAARGYQHETMRLTLNDRTLSSAIQVREVTVYTLLGSVVSRTILSSPAKSVALARVRPGTYFVQAVGSTGERATLRWSVPK